MATALIPEVIQPGVLYSPSVSNQFSAPFATALPNTDVGMSVLGLTGGGYRAYQPAISGIHYPAAAADPFCVLFWQYDTGSNSSTGTSSMNAAQTLMIVHDATMVVDNSPLGSTTGFRWALTGTNTANFPKTWVWHVAVGASSRAYLNQNTFTIPTSAWHSHAFRKDTSAGPIHNDFALNVINSASVAGTIGTRGALVSPYFSIGPYSLTAGWASGNKDIRYAKIALFDYYVTDAELLDLLDSMTNGPPSPP